jgi:hypothetical protein|tara:strand:+ start:447 stop:692 length:246 start_codon:yes stop_codon:yes gene_type:complete
MIHNFRIEHNPNGTYCVLADDTDTGREIIVNDALTKRDALECAEREQAREDAFNRGENFRSGPPNNDQLIIDAGMIPNDYR